MRILLSWLREFVDVPESADALAATLSMRGFAFEDLEPAPPGAAADDAVLDVEVTANRPDCLSVIGIAREVATAYDRPLRLPSADSAPPLDVHRLTPADDADLRVEIDDADLCPRFAAAVAEVTVGPSPGWLADRLTATGVRPISNVVDITNYVLMEMGQPMHAYDLARVDGGTLRARRAREGEIVRTLDGVERRATPDMLLIADDRQAQGVGGVMGGADSEVGSGTRLVAFEAAYFEPTSVRRTSKRLALKTEAAARFERGADIGVQVAALERACALLERIGAGTARGTVVDRYPDRRQPARVTLRASRIARVVGEAVEAADVVRILASLGFGVDEREAGVWSVEVPSRRVDVSREIDLIEEVARHHGFENVPATFPVLAAMPAPPDPRIARDARVRRILQAAGYSEAMTFTFLDRDAVAAVAPDVPSMAIANPLSESFVTMRPSLWPGLVASIAHNRRRARRDVRLFEIGSRFSPRDGESRVVAFAATGAAHAEHWSGDPRPVDFFDLKGTVDRIGEALGVRPAYERADRPALVPGRTAVVRAADSGATLGLVGQLAPAVAESRDLPADDDVFVAELDLDAIADVATVAADRPVQPLPRYPSIVRDVALLVDESLPAATLRGTIRTAAPETLVHVREFDRYAGRGVPDGSVSLAFRLTFRSLERTLTDDEVQEAMNGIVNTLEREHGARRR